MPEQPRVFNPLHRVNLGRSVETALLARPRESLTALERFVGAGVYAIYYEGDFPAYQPIADKDVPIYVGKAVPPGTRRGKFGLDVEVGTVLHDRLKEHGGSLDAAQNLDIEDFTCRYLVVEDIWIPLGESLLIAHFAPVWNQAVDGFGLHDPGGGRHGGRRSDWDQLHPGRHWRDKMTQHKSDQQILSQISRHFQEHPPAEPHELPPPGEDTAPDPGTED